RAQGPRRFEAGSRERARALRAAVWARAVRGGRETVAAHGAARHKARARLIFHTRFSTAPRHIVICAVGRAR
ncbi:MAG: hypothetical protein AAFR16_11215, partial [Pseudomonadota bacterium]